MVMNNIIFAGIDGGGTHCRVRLETANGVLLGTGMGGSANPSHGLSTVIQSIETAFNIAFKEAGLSESDKKRVVVGAGLAGLHLPLYRELMASWQHPFHSCYYTDDLTVATIGAHDGEDGAVIIIGTGFSALSIVNNVRFGIGGHGFLMADKCSGSWIGYQGVQAALLADDGLAEKTVLSDLLYQKTQSRGLELANYLVGAKAREYGALAPLVFEAASFGDPVSQNILTGCCEFVSMVIDRVNTQAPPRISLIGGVAERLFHMLSLEQQACLSPAKLDPEQGAIRFAKQQMTASERFTTFQPEIMGAEA